MALLLIILMLLFAAAGGFLGEFLELAGVFILILALVGLLIGLGVAAAVRRVVTPGATDPRGRATGDG